MFCKGVRYLIHMAYTIIFLAAIWPPWVKAVSLYHSCVHWIALFNLRTFSCIHSLTNWHKRPGFGPVSAFNMSFSLSLIIFYFWFEVRDMRFLFSLEHLEVTVELLIDPISVFCVSVNREAGAERKRWRKGWCRSGQNTHDTYYVCHRKRVRSWCRTPKITGHKSR